MSRFLAAVSMALLLVGSASAQAPLTLTVSVSPPHPFDPYTVTCYYNPVERVWIGHFAKNNKRPADSDRLVVRPYEQYTDKPYSATGRTPADRLTTICRFSFVPADFLRELAVGRVFIMSDAPFVAGPNVWKEMPLSYQLTIYP